MGNSRSLSIKIKSGNKIRCRKSTPLNFNSDILLTPSSVTIAPYFVMTRKLNNFCCSVSPVPT